MRARLIKPARSAMTSGTRNTQAWVLEFVPDDKKSLDPLMGWTSASDTASQVRLRFDSREAAETYAERHGLTVVLQEEQSRKPNIRPMGYGGNFAHNRRGAWTH